MRYTNVAEVVDVQVPIETVLYELFGIDVPPGAGEWKTYCPLGQDHSDGGTSRAMRVYSESNSAYCFSHGRSFTPVAIWMLKHGGPRFKAAREMAAHYEISTKPKTAEERWNSLNDSQEREIDTEVLRTSLINYARTLKGYDAHQFEAMDLLTAILRTADDLSGEATYDTMKEWLDKSKYVLDEYWRTHEWN